MHHHHLLPTLGADFSLPRQHGMNLALELCPMYWRMVDTYDDLGMIFADAPIEIRAQAQEDRLQILKRLEAQAAPDAVVSKSPDEQNL